MQFTYPDIKRAITSRFTVLEPAISDLELEWHPDSPGPYTLVGQVLTLSTLDEYDEGIPSYVDIPVHVQ